MPSNLSSVVGVEFRSCKNINDVIVFPTTFTSISATEGPFAWCGTSTSPKTYVFLGDMETFCFGPRDGRYNNVSFFFANPNDEGVTSMTFKIAYPSAPTNCYAYFCASETYYDLNFKAPSEKYVVTGNEFKTYSYTEDMAQHLHSPRLDAHEDATCTSAAGSFTYCFCGKEISFVAEEGSVALGHIYDDSNIVEKILPTLENGKVDFYSDSTYVYACPQCSTDISRVEVGTSFFTKSGYSSNEEDKANVVFVIVANYKNIQQYVGENDAEIAYGVVVSANTTGTPLSYVDGQVKEGANTVKVDMTNTSYSKMTVKVTKVGDLSLHCCGYISFNGEISYLNHATVDDTALEVSLSIINSILNPQVTPPVEEDPSEEIPVE